MLRLLTNEVDKMQEQVSNVNRGRMPLMALVDWTQLRKQSLSKKIYQQNPRKLKTKEKKTEQRISKDCRTTKGIRYVQLEYQKIHCRIRKTGSGTFPLILVVRENEI